MSEHKYYLSTGPHPRNPHKLIAVISLGQPQYGDKKVLVCTVTTTTTQAEAEKWFKEQLAIRPWETRQ